MRRAEKDLGFITNSRLNSRQPEIRLNDFDYADDIALLERTLNGAQQQLEETARLAKEVGLEINIPKTKVMVMNTDYDNQNGLKLNNETIERVDDFKYLGSLMASCETDMKTRKGQAWGAFWKMKNIWFSKSISISMKVRLFQDSCISILLYGSET